MLTTVVTVTFVFVVAVSNLLLGFAAAACCRRGPESLQAAVAKGLRRISRKA